MVDEFDASDPATWTPWQREQIDAWRRRHKRDRHEREIAEWAARQRHSYEWVNFAEIADWCAREPGGVKRNEDRRTQAFRDLSVSVMAGEFSRAGRWYVVRLPDGPTSITKPLWLRVTLVRLQKWPAFRSGMTIPDQELARWWVPRDLCARWFEARQIAPPPWLAMTNENRLMRQPLAPETLPALPVNTMADVDEAPYCTGLPGRPTSWHLIEGECRRRYQAGERHPNNAGREMTAEWSRVLGTWLSQNHPDAARVTQKTLSNRLAGLLRELQGAMPTKS